MIDSFYVAATGMSAQQTFIDTIANNVSNINTTAFKKGRVNFEDLFYRRLNPTTALASNPSFNQVGLGAAVTSTSTLFTQGNLVQTNAPLDVAIQGNGFLQVEDSSRNLFYTRLGSLQLTADGQIQTTSGYSLASSIKVPPDASQVIISQNGAVTAVVPNKAQPVLLGQIELANFINPDGLNSLGNGLYSATDASGQPTYAMPGENGIGTLSQGYLESSNVDLNTELTNLVLAQQAYQMNSQVVQVSDQIVNSIVTLRR